MRRALILALAAFAALDAGAKRHRDLDNATAIAKAADEQLRSDRTLTPEKRAEQEQVKAGAVRRIEEVAKSDPGDAETQIDVSRSLASVSEAPRAIPYAERGLSLAEKSGDPAMLRAALLAGADAYYRAGRYDESRARAERLLKADPKDKDAMMLFMQVKNRGSAATRAGPGSSTTTQTPAPASAPTGGAAATPAAAAAAAPAVPMTNAGGLEARRHLELGRSVMRLDPKAALGHFDAALAAAPEDVDALAARARARLETGDAGGARADAEAAARLAPGRADVWGLRAAAGKELGRPEAELLADLEKAASLDPLEFRDAYRELVARASGAANAAASTERPLAAGSPAPPGGFGRYARIGAFAGGLGCTIAALLLRRRRSDEDGSPRG